MTNAPNPLRVYVASSWRNVAIYPTVVEAIRALGFEVYDFKNPGEGKRGFSWGEVARSWSQIDEDWKKWTTAQYLDALQTPIAQHGFDNDMKALQACDICVLVMPCGRSAHLEAGWATGAGKKTLVLWTDGQEAELMNKMHHGVYGSIEALCAELVKIRDKAQMIGNVRKVTDPEARYALRRAIPMFRTDPRLTILNFVHGLMLSQRGATDLRASLSDEALLLQGEEAATYVENMLGDTKEGSEIDGLLDEVKTEVLRQKDKWGLEHDRDKSGPEWIALLVARLGKLFDVTQEALRVGIIASMSEEQEVMLSWRKRLVQTAAVAVSALVASEEKSL